MKCKKGNKVHYHTKSVGNIRTYTISFMQYSHTRNLTHNKMLKNSKQEGSSDILMYIFYSIYGKDRKRKHKMKTKQISCCHWLAKQLLVERELKV